MGREEIFIDLGGGAPKTPISYGKLAEIRIFTVFARWMACGPLTLKNLHGVWRGGPVRGYGTRADRQAGCLTPPVRAHEASGCRQDRQHHDRPPSARQWTGNHGESSA